MNIVPAVFGRRLLFGGLVLCRRLSFFTRDLECFEQVADIGCGAAQVLCYFVLIGIGMFCHIAAQFFFVDTFRIAAFGAVLQRTCFFFEGNPLVKGSVGNAEGACGLAEVAVLFVVV